MPDFTPIARSPIAPSPAGGTPVLREGWEVGTASSSAALCLTDCTPLCKIIVRADPQGAVADAFDTPHGRARRDDSDVLVVGSSPGEWTLIGNDIETVQALAQGACDADPNAFTSIIDQTHGRALMRLSGERASDLLAKLCGIDLDDRVTPQGSAFRSSVAKVVSDVARDDIGDTPSYWIHCERSSGQYLFDALFDAGAEFGIEVGSRVNEAS